MSSADRHPDQSLDSQTQKMRSRLSSFGRLSDRRSMLSCCRNPTFSVSNAALSSYLVTKERSRDVFSTPGIGFAFVHLASHFALDLLEMEEAEATMEYIEGHQPELVQMTEGQ